MGGEVQKRRWPCSSEFLLNEAKIVSLSCKKYLTLTPIAILIGLLFSL